MKRREPIFNFSEPVPVWLCAVLIFIHTFLWICETFSVIPALQTFAKIVDSVAPLAAMSGDVLLDRNGFGSIPSLLLHGFVHADYGHVLMNSAMIAIFGVMICRAAGSGPRGEGRFLAIFLISVIAGGLTEWVVWTLMESSALAVGASGGASGLMAAAAYALGGRTQMLKWGLGWLIINLLILAADRTGIMYNNIAIMAHLGGYVGGALAALVVLRPGSTDLKFTR